MARLRVFFLRKLVTPADLAGGTAVVIDVLRASTTMVYAIAAGALSVIPCLTVGEARRRAGELPPGTSVLAGERKGVRIKGFDLGNSPAEFTRQSVGGKNVVMTTTNGTRTLLHCDKASEVLIGAFVNFTALCEALAAREQIDIVCSGTDGDVTRDDVVLAGAIVTYLHLRGKWEINDEAAIARDAWTCAVPDTIAAAVVPRAIEAMLESRGGRNLVALGMQHDIELAADVDRFAIVPRFHPSRGTIALD